MRLLPEAVIPARVDRGRILPAFLDERDQPWLHVLIDEVDRFRGRPLRELQQRLREPLPCATPHFKSRAAVRLLLRLGSAEITSEVSPAAAREKLFVEAAVQTDTPRGSIVAAAASALGLAPAALERALFADLPGERVFVGPESFPPPHELALRVNQLIARSLLFRASRVRIRAQGALRPVVRQAKLRGLICTVEDGDPPVLDLSGPYAVFRRTLLYGRALGELLPFLAWCARFELCATCMFRGQEAELHLQSSDPFFPASAPKPFDSKLEARFARDLKKAAPDWDLVREPEPVRAGGTIIFPDFLLRHRLDPSREFLVEVVGFWTPDYLQRKFSLLRAAKLDNLILCLDQERACADGDLPTGARVVHYRRRIDPTAVLRAAGHAL
jgi:predicted nuclease of restriction endonuclease-like RecB superfamily